MSITRHLGTMRLIIDNNCITFYNNNTATLIERPSSVSINEWESFWNTETENKLSLISTAKNRLHEKALENHRQHFAK